MLIVVTVGCAASMLNVMTVSFSYCQPKAATVTATLGNRLMANHVGYPHSVINHVVKPWQTLVLLN
jgi:hypothetical protein